MEAIEMRELETLN